MGVPPTVLFLLSSDPSVVSPQRGCELGLAGGVKCRAAHGTPGGPAGELGTQRQSPSLFPSPGVKASPSKPEWAWEVSHYKVLSLRRGERSRDDKARLFSRHLAPLRCCPGPRTPCPSSVSQHVLSPPPLPSPPGAEPADAADSDGDRRASGEQTAFQEIVRRGRRHPPGITFPPPPPSRPGSLHAAAPPPPGRPRPLTSPGFE